MSELLLADQLRIDALKAQARIRKEQAEAEDRNLEPMTDGEGGWALAQALECVAKAAAAGNHSCDVPIPKAAARKHVAIELRKERLRVSDMPHTFTLRVEWTL